MKSIRYRAKLIWYSTKVPD